MLRKTLPLLALAAAASLGLAGCSSAAAPAPSPSGSAGALNVVASTNVYGDIAAAIGGDRITVSSIISSTSQDPHEYEATAQDQLTIADADLIIENGGGYDSFIDTLIDATKSKAPVVTAVEYSHDWPDSDGDHDHDDAADDHDDEHADAAEDAHDHDHDHDHVEGFNEHVWYDPHTIEHVAEEIADELSDLDPAGADTYEANYKTFAAGIADLEASLKTISDAHHGEKIFVTEPVPLYLTAAAGLENATPAEFSEAVEEGQDVPPATLLQSLDIVKSGDVHIVIANAQTGGAETTQIIDAAKAQSIPVLEVTEVMPQGKTYLTWMADNIAQISGALTR